MSLEASPSLNLLVVEDSDLQRRTLCRVLEAHGYRTQEATDGKQALELFMKQRPDMVLLDVEMPGDDGYLVARKIRAAEAGDWTPIIFLSGHSDESALWRGIEAGGDDYIIKPIAPLTLLAKLHAMHRLLRMRRRLIELSQRLQSSNEQLEHLSLSDALTGLGNRRDFERRLQSELDRMRSERQPLTLILCDIDHFKRYNDALGHPAGDACLEAVAMVLRGVCRPGSSHRAMRYGGEEFALLLPQAPPSGALALARVLQRLLSRRALPHPDSPVSAWVTLSGGITTCIPDESTSAAGLLLRADEALYTAKSAGRARFFSFEMQVEVAVPNAIIEAP